MSSRTNKISMTSKKQHIRLWFECLQICHIQAEFKDDLRRSSEFYREWGNVVGVRFDDWWREKKYLFDEVNVREVSRVTKSPNTITLNIPLNEKISVIQRDVRRIVEKKQSELLTGTGVNTDGQKSKVPTGSKYTFTQKEVKGVFHYVNLEIYKIYLRLGRPPINRKFLIEVRKDFDSRKRSQLKKTVLSLPHIKDFESRFTTNVSLDDVIRSVRRGIRGVDKTLANVSKGRFP